MPPPTRWRAAARRGRGRSRPPWRRRLVEGQGRPHGAGALQEEAHRLVLGQQRGIRRRVGGRHRKRIDGHLVLATHAQRRAAGGQHLEGGTGAQAARRRAPRWRPEVLAVVEEQQRLPGTEGARQFVGDRLTGHGVSPTAAATAAGTSAGSASGARSTQITPSAKEPATSSASARASRVLPTPPGPVKVSSGTASSSKSVRAARRSASRPMSRVRGIGRSAEADAAIGDAPNGTIRHATHSVPDSPGNVSIGAPGRPWRPRRHAWAPCPKDDPMSCAARTRSAVACIAMLVDIRERVSCGLLCVLEMAIGMDRYHVQSDESEIAVSEALFAWRGGEIVLLGEQDGDRWYLSRGWKCGDRLTDVRRWSFANSARFVTQVRRLVLGCGAGSVPCRPGGRGGGRLGLVADRWATGRGVSWVRYYPCHGCRGTIDRSS